MPAPINIHVYSDALVLLGTAGIVIPLVRRFGLNPVLGYLGAGAILGPLGLGSFIGKFPFLYWLTVVDAKNVAGIADLGIVFLLFLIGMELSYERLKSMRRLIFGLGGSADRALDRGDRQQSRPWRAASRRWRSSSVPASLCPRPPSSSKCFPGRDG